MQVLNIPIDKVNAVIHISDVHIRNLKRHKEYKLVFNKLYSEIKNKLNKNTIIILSGDIVHSKTETSPELMELVGEFLQKLSELTYVILTAGNHDANLSNKNRLDVLTPIVNLMDNKNIFYLKNSGIYSFANVNISNMSVFDKSSEYITADKLNAEYKIAIYHGPLNNAITDVGFRFEEGLHKDFFTGFDFVILGDIHRKQIIQEYCEEELEVELKELNKYLKDGWVKIEDGEKEIS